MNNMIILHAMQNIKIPAQDVARDGDTSSAGSSSSFCMQKRLETLTDTEDQEHENP
jgi:hypothetical protein